MVDTSVIVAAFASWHEQHEAADRELDGAGLLAHCAVESYSVLTRLPPPHRVRPELVREFLAQRFPDAPVALDSSAYPHLIGRAVELGIAGGAIYDALIGATASAVGAELVSCDSRAASTYERLGVSFRLLS